MVNFYTTSATTKLDAPVFSQSSVQDEFADSQLEEYQQKHHAAPPMHWLRIIAMHQGLQLPCVGNPHERFELISRIEDSRFGSVWKAKDLQTGQLCAVKISSFLKWISRHPSDSENFLREARVMQQLPASDSMTQLVGTAWDQDNHWVITNFVEGMEMFKHITKFGPQPEPIARKWFKQVAQHIALLHHNNLCFLDVSLENLMVNTDTDKVTLVDFGQLRSFQRGSDNVPLPYDHSVPINTKSYCCPPELLSRQPFRGDLVDMYGLGICLYIMFAGFLPFKKEARNTNQDYLDCAAGRVAFLARRNCFQFQRRGCTKCHKLHQEAEARGDRNGGASCGIPEDVARLIGCLLTCASKRMTIDELLQCCESW
jgi:serine/threonine protein kinase